MRLESIKSLAAAAVAFTLVIAVGTGRTRSFGDEPGRLGRLFRMGGSSTGSGSTAAPDASTAPPTSSYVGQPALSTPPSSLPGTPASAIAPRVTPKPRVNRPVTEADPLVTRISLGRSDNGSQFGMLLQVFADGTVIDGEGVHRVSPEALKPVMDAVTAGDFARLKGHCGGPAGDFIENVHVVVFDRSLGRLRANAFSYSGNPQGCDHAVIHLQKALDEIQNKLSGVAPSVAPTAHNAPNRSLSTPSLPLTSP